MATTVEPPVRAGAQEPPSANEPALPGWLRDGTAALFGSLSALRGGRIVHPDGVAHEATLAVAAGGEATGVELFDRPARHRAIVRLSRSVGLPRPLPDAIGLALRVCDAHGEGRHQDFLLITSGDGPLVHHLIVPAVRGTYGHSYSSLLAYRLAGRLRLVGALPRPNHGGFDLSVAPLSGRWRPVAAIELGDRLPPHASERLRFNPWNTGGGIDPAGPFQGLRGPAYRGSQAGRGARDQ